LDLTWNHGLNQPAFISARSAPSVDLDEKSCYKCAVIKCIVTAESCVGLQLGRTVLLLLVYQQPFSLLCLLDFQTLPGLCAVILCCHVYNIIHIIVKHLSNENIGSEISPRKFMKS